MVADAPARAGAAERIIRPPDYRERVLFVGENGSGKTTLARALLSSGYRRYVVLDSKGDFPTDPDDTVITAPDDKRWLRRYPDKIVYRPGVVHGTGRWLDYTLSLCYDRAQKVGKAEPFVVYVDEALFLSRQGTTKWLSGLAVTGRSLGVGLWCSSQRPAWIPVEVRSEAWRMYVFALGYVEDKKEVVKYANGQLTIHELEQATENYSFLEIRRHPEQAGSKLIQRYPRVNV